MLFIIKMFFLHGNPSRNIDLLLTHLVQLFLSLGNMILYLLELKKN